MSIYNTSLYDQSGIMAHLLFLRLNEWLLSYQRLYEQLPGQRILFVVYKKTVKNNLPIGPAGSLPVKYDQYTALLRANSAEATAKMNKIVSDLVRIFLAIEWLFTKKFIEKIS